MAFHVFRNETHVTVVNDEDVTLGEVVGAENDAYGQAVDAAAEAHARTKFEAVGLETATMHRVSKLDPEEDSAWYGDCPEDAGIGEAAFYAASLEVEAQDLSEIDSDAVVSGYNIQSWAYVDPEHVFEHLAGSAPVPYERSTPDREHAFRELKKTIASLKAMFDPSLFSADPEASARVAMFKAEFEGLFEKAGPGAKPKTELSSIIRTWEVGADSAADFTEDQRKPWSLDVKLQGTQLFIDLTPFGRDADEGMQIVVEVNKGYPAVHLAPGRHQDQVMHVHALNADELEVTADRPEGVEKVSKGVVYDSQSFVFS